MLSNNEIKKFYLVPTLELNFHLLSTALATTPKLLFIITQTLLSQKINYII